MECAGRDPLCESQGEAMSIMRLGWWKWENTVGAAAERRTGP